MSRAAVDEQRAARRTGRGPRNGHRPRSRPLVMRRRTSLAALALAVPGLVATATPASAALGTGVTQQILVSDPTAYESRTDYSIHEAIVKMVDETPAGATITHMVWNLTYTRYADALIRAHKRGVTVYVAQNGQKSSTQMDSLRGKRSRPLEDAGERLLEGEQVGHSRGLCRARPAAPRAPPPGAPSPRSRFRGCSSGRT